LTFLVVPESQMGGLLIRFIHSKAIDERIAGHGTLAVILTKSMLKPGGARQKPLSHAQYRGTVFCTLKDTRRLFTRSEKMRFKFFGNGRQEKLLCLFSLSPYVSANKVLNVRPMNLIMTVNIEILPSWAVVLCLGFW